MGFKSNTKKILQLLLGKYYLYIFAFYRLIMFNIDNHEKPFRRFLKTIDTNSNVLDIGANLGIITFFLSKKIKNGKVFSFEPIPQNFNVMSFIVKIFGLKNVSINQIALGNENKNTQMILPEVSGVKLFGLEHIKELETPGFNEGNEYGIQMRRLDEFNQLENLKIDLIKMDVENYELEVLKGAEKLIKKHKPVILCELWKNEFRDKVINYLESMDYKTKIIEGDELIDFSNEKHNTQDFFFVCN
jgi:FkbM family methyltransferase